MTLDVFVKMVWVCDWDVFGRMTDVKNVKVELISIAASLIRRTPHKASHSKTATISKIVHSTFTIVFIGFIMHHSTS